MASDLYIDPVADFGADPTGVADCSAAFASAIAALPNGGRIWIPPGQFLFRSELHIPRPIIIEGAGGVISSITTRLQFLTCHGIIFDAGAAGAALRDINIHCYFPAVSSVWHGIMMHSACAIKDGSCDGWTGNGVYVHGFSTDTPASNCEGFEIARWWNTNCKGHGYIFEGDKSSFGLVKNTSAATNTGCGFCDKSPYGQTYIQCHSATNGLIQGTQGGAPYWFSSLDSGGHPSGTQKTTVIGQYTEGGQGPSYMRFPALVIGGEVGAQTLDSDTMRISDFPVNTFGITAAQAANAYVTPYPGPITPVPWDFPPAPPTIPAPPSGIVATAGVASVFVTWAAVGNATSYKVKRSLVSGGAYTLLTTLTGTSYTDAGLTNGTPYFYIVTALNTVGESPNSSEVSAVPYPPLPGIPSGVRAAGANMAVDLFWLPSPDAASYNVKRSSLPGGPYTIVGTAPSSSTPSYIDGGLINGRTYYYVVSSVNTTGESANSSEASAVTRNTLLTDDGYEVFNDPTPIGGMLVFKDSSEYPFD